jgi:protein-lysine N-methyltransferase EEF2KMT
VVTLLHSLLFYSLNIGYVSETNATNVFMVTDEGTLCTPIADSCLPGITRGTVIDIAKNELKINVEERRISLAEFHFATEVFTTGTMGELTPVTLIDGRIIGTGTCGPITKQLQTIYKTLPERGIDYATPIPEFDV